MNKRQMNKLAMYRATQALLADAPPTGSIPAFPAAFARFEAKIAEIEALSATQAALLPATIAHREMVFEEMIDAVVTVAGIGSTYANRHQLGDFAVKMRGRAIDFARMRVDERVPRAQAIVDALRPLVPRLADYGVTPDSLDAVQEKIVAADRVSPSARMTIAEKRAATAELLRTHRATDALLAHELDALLRPLQRTHAQFHENYRAIREVVDTPGGRAAADADAEAAPAPAVVPLSPLPERQAA